MGGLYILRERRNGFLDYDVVKPRAAIWRWGILGLTDWKVLGSVTI